MSSRSNFECFGLVIQGFGWDQAKSRLEDALAHGQKSWFVTANPEILLEAKRNPAYWHAIRQADLRLVDGFGLQLIGWLFQASPKRLTGVELSEQLLRLADEKKWKVLFLGGEDGSADKAGWKMRERFPNLQIIAEEYVKIGRDGNETEDFESKLEKIKNEAPDLILVAFGHPKQEFWISKHVAELPNLKAIVGVGGTFDFWIEKQKRAPEIFQKLGLEWLWRLFLEPKRWKRILNAVIIFPLKAIADRFSR